MEHPVKEIGGVIKSLTQGSPDVQESTLREYFLPNASFSHPYCRLILAIYRWYRTLSPHIDLKVDSAAFDQKSGLLYVSIRQTFALWFIPLYKAPVKLVSVLQLTQLSPESSSEDEGPMDSKPRRQNPRYYIASQEDLYPVNDCIQFLCPRSWSLLVDHLAALQHLAMRDGIFVVSACLLSAQRHAEGEEKNSQVLAWIIGPV
ncbi:monooxygenase [Fusarium oxysporum]|nr:monooxygenase [Fusarium oxysporum]